jgi:hypothetical protein
MPHFFCVQSNSSGRQFGHIECNEVCCKGCGRRLGVPVAPIRISLSRKSKRWPDAFGVDDFCGFVVREGIVDQLVVEGINAESIIKTEIIFDSGEDASDVPSYYCVVPFAGLSLNLEASKLVVGVRCEVCRNSAVKSLPVGFNPTAMHPDEKTWQGLPLFRLQGIIHPGTFCSQEFVDLVGRNKWKNFEFRQLGTFNHQ